VPDVANIAGVHWEQADDWFKVELDSHADTCCVGDDVLVVNETLKTVKVSPLLQSLGTVSKVPIVSAAMAYDHPRSCKVFISIVHQALHFKELKHCLLCPMQLRLNDVVINERPKFLTTGPTQQYHAIICGDLLIPLELHSVTSYFLAENRRRRSMRRVAELISPFLIRNGYRMMLRIRRRNRVISMKMVVS
jgi:hypothetical protein